MRIAVCDDDSIMLNAVCNCINEFLAENKLAGSLKKFSSPVMLLNSHKNNPFDVLFLDIKMPEMNGFELAENVNDSIPIVFVTSCDDMVYESINYRPFGFIRKSNPIRMKNDVKKTMPNIMRHLKQNCTISIDIGYGELEYMRIKDINFVKSSGHYLEWNMTNGAVLRCRGKFSEFSDTLLEYDFVKIHHCYYINMKNIYLLDIRNEEVIMLGNISLAIARTMKENLLEQYREFNRKKT